MSNSSSSSSCIGFTGLLTVVLIALKLLGKITWSWWWVLPPPWISALLVVGLIVALVPISLALSPLTYRGRQ